MEYHAELTFIGSFSVCVVDGAEHRWEGSPQRAGNLIGWFGILDLNDAIGLEGGLCDGFMGMKEEVGVDCGEGVERLRGCGRGPKTPGDCELMGWWFRRFIE